MASTHIEIENNGNLAFHLYTVIARICYLYMSISNLHNQSVKPLNLLLTIISY